MMRWALACDPRLIIADEARPRRWDVMVQAQVLDLF